jgi:hypothetical protein
MAVTAPAPPRADLARRALDVGYRVAVRAALEQTRRAGAPR